MNYAITTKFIGPTNTRGSRVKAFLPSGLSVTLSWDHAIDPDANHRNAALACAQKHLIDGYAYLSEKAPWVHEKHEIHGLKSGYVCIVRLVPKDGSL
jgi:hypothetical protein